jgi:DNA phosphorothioation-associated putative methyltransferase
MGGRGAAPGKRVGGALYLHRSALAALEPGQGARVAALAARCSEPWNVAKLDLAGDEAVSLLEYEPFAEAAFPALRASHRLSAEGALVRRRYGAENPPILHRKELLLLPDHPDRARFAALTRDLEARGLFVDMARRGRRKPWDAALQAAGLAIEDHRVVARAAREAPAPQVERHRTAIARSALSAPVSALQEAGFLTGERGFLDYGCGRGDDVRLLQAAGIAASGWDPHYAPDPGLLTPRPLVNLGFVLNVIEDRQERREALRAAWALTEQVLSVAVMLLGKSDVSGHLPCGDGFLSTRGTFQKYYSQAEIAGFLSEVLGRKPIAAGPGVFFVFRDEMLEQRYLAQRLSPGQDLASLAALHSPRAIAPGGGSAARQKLLADLAELTLLLGRTPHGSELPERLRSGLKRAGLSLARALTAALGDLPEARLAAASARRKAEVARYLAMQHFAARSAYRKRDPQVQRDVKAFFGTVKAAEAAGRALLFSIGDPEVLLEEAQDLQAQGLGRLRHGVYELHIRDLDRLTPRLRTYVGIAELVIGSLDPATLLALEFEARKVLTRDYPKFEEEALPRLGLQGEVDLRSADVRYRDHAKDGRVSVLLGKSDFMQGNEARYAAQAHFDAALLDLLSEADPHRLPFSEIAQRLLQAKLPLPY